MVLSDVLAGAFVVFIATALGALGVLAIRRLGKRGYSVMLAFAAGTMAFTSIEMALQSHQAGGDAMLIGGLLCGIMLILLTEHALPHIHMHMKKEELKDSKKKAILMSGSIALHNIPEGLSIASAFAASGPFGWLVTASIALQDIPEGALIAAPLHAYGIGKRSAVFYGMLSGFIEGVAAIAGYLFLDYFRSLVPFALSFAAGAMTYVVFVEILPDAMAGGRERIAGAAFIFGALVALGIATIFGG